MTRKTIPALLIAAITLTTQASVSHANTVPSFLDGVDATPMTQSEMQAVRGEFFPLLLITAVRLAPSLSALLAGSMRNHFPVMLIRQAWAKYRGK
jgi:hypothetical protein